ncbi:hypothetical protein DPMN_099883 [Dreissena polymorpha]|uniref:Uncharacterized protein n=1 Tax=Dreissena polymorpha TaxID=45954 RepID=A0A9D4LH57_DREPO|nr:hypothetical protein DPMN_099883 [Dreissena polymorpha]
MCCPTAIHAPMTQVAGAVTSMSSHLAEECTNVKFSTILNFVTHRSPVMGASGGSSVTSRRSTGERPWKWRTLSR